MPPFLIADLTWTRPLNLCLSLGYSFLTNTYVVYPLIILSKRICTQLAWFRQFLYSSINLCGCVCVSVGVSGYECESSSEHTAVLIVTPSFHVQDNSVWTITMDTQILEWLNQQPQDWWGTTKSNVYTWGKGSWNQLGHSTRERATPALADDWTDVQMVGFCSF